MIGGAATRIAIALLLAAFAAPAVAAEAPRPNVVFILADDLGYGDLSSYGAADIRTPNIDRLAQEGVRFTEFYSAANTCSPSRAALMTGRYPPRSGVNAVLFHDTPEGLPASELTIAELLRDAGYRTAMVGKWHLGNTDEFMPLEPRLRRVLRRPPQQRREELLRLRRPPADPRDGGPVATDPPLHRSRARLPQPGGERRRAVLPLPRPQRAARAPLSRRRTSPGVRAAAPTATWSRSSMPRSARCWRSSRSSASSARRSSSSPATTAPGWRCATGAAAPAGCAAARPARSKAGIACPRWCAGRSTFPRPARRTASPT